MAKWYIHEHDHVSGPFSAGDMRRKVEAGEVTGNTMIRKDAHSKFLAAKSFQGLIKEDTVSKPTPDQSKELELEDNVPTQVGSDTKMPTPSIEKHHTTLKDGDHVPSMNTTMVTDNDIGEPPTDLLDTRDTEQMDHPVTVRTVRTENVASNQAVPPALLLLSKIYLPIGFVALIAIVVIAARM